MTALFQFEQDGRYALRRIPMIVRFNLDAIGIRFDFPAWAVLTREERQELVDLPCTTDAQKARYRQRILDMLASHAELPDLGLEDIAVDSDPPWCSTTVPADVVDTLSELDLPIPTDVHWQALSDLQRFVLIKLTRRGHKNANLQAALDEFGLNEDGIA
ncbi:MAG: nitrate reductase associated protein [Oxalicibacterium faecigallinarum]|uniref:nitrate reductase associated protein n=1 Tax=Oxalicibacterium faecigallinarum TaxID=573741 RepID=UPI0028077FF9|nr:nitrate reductase associated protein [Oxalicibacterium faecigallinarum]MDQ7970606.1 nitrate reductase associated protein [Oxalicibacterium faecigallinarum]